MKTDVQTSPWLLAGALNGLIAVAFAAYGAHGAGMEPAAAQLYQLGYLFQLMHGLALLVVGVLGRRLARGRALLGFAATGFLLGIILFSGSLYWLALHGPGSLNGFSWLTPVGGTSLMIGWLALILLALTRPRDHFSS